MNLSSIALIAPITLKVLIGVNNSPEIYQWKISICFQKSRIICTPYVYYMYLQNLFHQIPQFMKWVCGELSTNMYIKCKYYDELLNIGV